MSYHLLAMGWLPPNMAIAEEYCKDACLKAFTVLFPLCCTKPIKGTKSLLLYLLPDPQRFIILERQTNLTNLQYTITQLMHCHGILDIEVVLQQTPSTLKKCYSTMKPLLFQVGRVVICATPVWLERTFTCALQALKQETQAHIG